MIKAMWIGTIALVGGLAGLRHGWKRRAADAVGCAVAVLLARWQYPRLVPYVRTLWPAWEIAGDGAVVRQVALVYLFVVLYGLSRALVSVCVPAGDGEMRDRRRWSGVIGAVQAGTLAALALTILPYV